MGRQDRWPPVAGPRDIRMTARSDGNGWQNLGVRPVDGSTAGAHMEGPVESDECPTRKTSKAKTTRWADVLEHAEAHQNHGQSTPTSLGKAV